MIECSFYWVSKKDGDQVTEVKIELPLDITVQEAIEEALPLINQELMNTTIRLDMDPSLYYLYVAKKNGHPKPDYPGNSVAVFI